MRIGCFFFVYTLRFQIVHLSIYLTKAWVDPEFFFNFKFASQTAIMLTEWKKFCSRGFAHHYSELLQEYESRVLHCPLQKSLHDNWQILIPNNVFFVKDSTNDIWEISNARRYPGGVIYTSIITWGFYINWSLIWPVSRRC